MEKCRGRSALGLQRNVEVKVGGLRSVLDINNLLYSQPEACQVVRYLFLWQSYNMFDTLCLSECTRNPTTIFVTYHMSKT